MSSSAGEDYDRTLSSRNAHQRKGSVFENTVTTVQHSTNTANTVLRWKHQTPETGKADVWLSIYGFVSVLDGPWSLRLPNPTRHANSAPDQRQIHQRQRPEIPDDICTYTRQATKQDANKRQIGGVKAIASVKYCRVY